MTFKTPSQISAFIKQAREVGLRSLIVADGLGWVGEWYELTGNASNGVIDPGRRNVFIAHTATARAAPRRSTDTATCRLKMLAQLKV